MSTERVKILSEMLAEAKEQRKAIESDIVWLEQKISSFREVQDATTWPVSPKKKRAKKNPRRRENTINSLAAKALVNAGRPLHGTELLSALHSLGSETTLKSMGNRLPKDGRLENLGRNIWALSKWSDDIKDDYRPKNKVNES